MPAGAFDLLDRPLVFVPVRWKGVASDDGGDAVVVDHRVDIQVEILDKDELADWLKLTAETVAPEKATDHALAVFKRVAKGWRKIKAGGRVPAFNDENIGRLLKWPGFDSAFGAAYWQAWNGRVEAREGNSEGSLAPGQAGEPTDATPPAETPSS